MSGETSPTTGKTIANDSLRSCERWTGAELSLEIRIDMEPLAERMRPRTLDEYIGQEHLVGQGAVLRRMIDSGHISSFILWGIDARSDHCPSIRNTLLHALGGDKWCKRCTRGNRSGEEREVLQFGFPDTLYRRNSSIL